MNLFYGPEDDDDEEQAQLDNHANLQNPDDEHYDKNYNSNSYDTNEHTQDENDNRSNQMNPNNDAYSSSRK